MKIVVVGAGAMGSIYAALFADAGEEVWIFDPWEAHTAAIEHNGLNISGASGDRCVKSIRIAQSGSELPEADLFIIATKASAIDDAAQLIAPKLSASAKVLTIQNGLGAGERVSEFINEQQIYIGVAEGFGAKVIAPGCVHHTAMNKIRIGAYNPSSIAHIEPLAKQWSQAGFNAQAYPDIEQLIWEKFICNVAYSAPCTVFNLSVKQLLSDSHASMVSQQCAREAWQVAKAKKINLSFEAPIEYVTAFGLKVGDAKPSMLLDHIAKRRSEISAINGRVPVVAEEMGLDAPFNKVLAAVILSREKNWC